MPVWWYERRKGRLSRPTLCSRQVIGLEVQKQKQFLNGDDFRRRFESFGVDFGVRHIENTCNKALESYVRKEVMMGEVRDIDAAHLSTGSPLHGGYVCAVARSHRQAGAGAGS